MALGIGDTLRDARRRQNRSLADAAIQTRVREPYLAALEEEEFATLGGDVYVKGFLRSYAKYLGLDPEPLVDVYRRHHQHDEDLSALTAPPIETVGGAGSQSGIVVAVVAVLLVILAVIGSRGGGDEVRPAAAPAPAPRDATHTPAVVEPAASVPAPPAGEATPPATASPTATPTAAPFSAVDAVVTVVGGPSYLRTEQGTPAFDGELSAGQSRRFSGDPGLQLRLGNAGVVELVVDGQAQGSLGRSGQVVVVTCSPGDTACAIREITP